MITRTTQLSDEEYCKEIIKACFDIYNKAAFDEEGFSRACFIHESYQEDHGEQAHNCIACNLADFNTLLLNSLNNYEKIDNNLEAFTSFLFYAYLLVERFEEIFRIIKLPDSYELKHFQTFKKIKRWTNFLKHPKAFLFVHHAEYFFESQVTIDNSKKEYIIIDTDFINEYYSGDKNNSKLYPFLTNKQKVIVIYPDLINLTVEFTTGQEHFIDIVCNNPVFKDLLSEKSVIKDYYETPIEVI
jgi:hypothetical protein